MLATEASARVRRERLRIEDVGTQPFTPKERTDRSSYKIKNRGKNGEWNAIELAERTANARHSAIRHLQRRDREDIFGEGAGDEKQSYQLLPQQVAPDRTVLLPPLSEEDAEKDAVATQQYGLFTRGVLVIDQRPISKEARVLSQYESLGEHIDETAVTRAYGVRSPWDDQVYEETIVSSDESNVSYLPEGPEYSAKDIKDYKRSGKSGWADNHYDPDDDQPPSTEVMRNRGYGRKHREKQRTAKKQKKQSHRAAVNDGSGHRDMGQPAAVVGGGGDYGYGQRDMTQTHSTPDYTGNNADQYTDGQEGQGGYAGQWPPIDYQYYNE